MNGDKGNPSESAPSSLILPPSSFLSRWRNAILGTLLVIGGLSAAAITLLARHSDNYALAAIAAGFSLVSAVLTLIFVVPPLARSARLEVKRFDLPIEVSGGGGIFLIILLVVGAVAGELRVSGVQDELRGLATAAGGASTSSIT